MKRYFGWTLFFALGAILGPILIALILSFFPRHSQILDAKEVELGRLIAVYRENLPPGRLFMSFIPPPNGSECGYDPEDVFPKKFEEFTSARKVGKFSAYEGYRALDQWRSESEDREFIAAVHEHLAQDLTSFEAGFLRRCIQSTLLSSACMNHVEAIGAQVERFDPNRIHVVLSGRHENSVVCTYVDGVVARKSMKLAPRPD